MKPDGTTYEQFVDDAFSALGRAVWDETWEHFRAIMNCCQLSVLSVEPYGMKPLSKHRVAPLAHPFSALGRAVWDETLYRRLADDGREPFSALGRAVWDETVMRSMR